MRALDPKDIVLGAPLPATVPCTADGLNAAFARNDAVRFECHDTLGTLVRLSVPGGEALASLRGAQVLSWTPAGADENCLWLSDAQTWSTERPVRGGIPVCWPWFGAHVRDPNAPAHGVARTATWQVYTTCATATEARICLKLINPSQYHAEVSPGAEVMVEIILNADLQVSLTTINTGDDAFDLSQALHTYLAVSDIGKTRITGLERAAYFDQCSLSSCPADRGPLVIDGEVDRIYRDVTGEIVVHDDAAAKTVTVRKTGSRSSVVWNPWIEKSASLGDMAAEDYRRMVCVETTNAGADVVRLKPGLTHQLSQTLSRR